MSRFVNEFGRIVLICSKSSLARNGVINELDEALRREAREGASDRLIPIALDDYVYSEWTPEREGLARAIRDKVIVDFRDVELDSQEFEAGIARLLGSLRREEPI